MFRFCFAVIRTFFIFIKVITLVKYLLKQKTTYLLFFLHTYIQDLIYGNNITYFYHCLDSSSFEIKQFCFFPHVPKALTITRYYKWLASLTHLLTAFCSKEIICQVINVLINWNNIIHDLPQQLDHDFVFNIYIGCTNLPIFPGTAKSNIKQKLQYLIEELLYKMNWIKINFEESEALLFLVKELDISHQTVDRVNIFFFSNKPVSTFLAAYTFF